MSQSPRTLQRSLTGFAGRSDAGSERDLLPLALDRRGCTEMEKMGWVWERQGACFQMWGCWSMGLEFRGDSRCKDILGIFRV